MTLTACHPMFSAAQRYIVYAAASTTCRAPTDCRPASSTAPDGGLT